MILCVYINIFIVYIYIITVASGHQGIFEPPVCPVQRTEKLRRPVRFTAQMPQWMPQSDSDPETS